MRLRKRWLTVAAIGAGGVACLWLAIKDAGFPKFLKIEWQSPVPIYYAIPCGDTNGDGRDEIFVSGHSDHDATEGFLVSIHDGTWQVETVPIPQGWKPLHIHIWDLHKNTWISTPLIFEDPRNFLWVSQRRDGWQWQKLVQVKYWMQTHVDGDGLVDDLIVEGADQFMYWFDLYPRVALRDKRRLPKGVSWWELIRPKDRPRRQVDSPIRHFHALYSLQLSDLDGDGKPETLIFHECLLDICTSSEVTIKPTQLPTARIVLPFSLSPPALKLANTVLVEDADGDGHREIVGIFRGKDRFFLMRFWFSAKGWQYEVLPTYIKDYLEGFASIRSGRQIWFFVASQVAVEGFCRLPRGWRRKQWEFAGFTGFVKDKETLRLVKVSSLWLSSNPVWNRLRRWSIRLRNWGVPVLILPYHLTFIEIWRWEPQGQKWVREARKGYTNAPGNLDVVTTDLNSNGIAELLLIEDHNRIWSTFAFQVGRWWKRWKFCYLWKPPEYLHKDFELWDGNRSWKVFVLSRNIMAVTLQ